jgi:hypothetical protein
LCSEDVFSEKLTENKGFFFSHGTHALRLCDAAARFAKNPTSRKGLPWVRILPRGTRFSKPREYRFVRRNLSLWPFLEIPPKKIFVALAKKFVALAICNKIFVALPPFWGGSPPLQAFYV